MDTCIREYADLDQLRNCKNQIITVDSSIHKIAKLLNLAGNEVRLKILYLIFKEEKMCPCDLSDVLDMTVPAISQHLRKLKDGDILRTVKKGKTIFYSLNFKEVELIMPLFKTIGTKQQTVKI
jgi:ArsR family transcriptional regulator, lead/cadmium/zinc/bismuth-responsive transcriptional repressor